MSTNYSQEGIDSSPPVGRLSSAKRRIWEPAAPSCRSQAGCLPGAARRRASGRHGCVPLGRICVGAAADPWLHGEVWEVMGAPAYFDLCPSAHPTPGKNPGKNPAVRFSYTLSNSLCGFGAVPRQKVSFRCQECGGYQPVRAGHHSVIIAFAEQPPARGCRRHASSTPDQRLVHDENWLQSTFW
jgi:hypothetical protein